MSDYCCADRRKSKNDKRAKGRFARYKKGGQFRSANVPMSNSQAKQS